MLVRLFYKDKIVKQSDIDVSCGLLESLQETFGIDFSQYRLSDMRQSINERYMDFFLKEEDYCKYRESLINKILDE